MRKNPSVAKNLPGTCRRDGQHDGTPRVQPRYFCWCFWAKAKTTFWTVIRTIHSEGYTLATPPEKLVTRKISGYNLRHYMWGNLHLKAAVLYSKITMATGIFNVQFKMRSVKHRKYLTSHFWPVFLSTLFNTVSSAISQVPLCRRMLGLNPVSKFLVPDWGI